MRNKLARRPNKKTLLLNISNTLPIEDLDLCIISNEETQEQSINKTDQELSTNNTTSVNITNCVDITDNNNNNETTSSCSLTYENLNIVEKQSHKSSNINTSVNETSKSEVTCSSRSSNTASSSTSNKTSSTNSNNTNSDDESASGSESSDSNSSTCEDINCTISKFPVKMIVLECCEDTLDSYILSKKISDLKASKIKFLNGLVD